jgi:hypothetical protein
MLVDTDATLTRRNQSGTEQSYPGGPGGRNANVADRHPLEEIRSRMHMLAGRGPAE